MKRSSQLTRIGLLDGLKPSQRIALHALDALERGVEAESEAYQTSEYLLQLQYELAGPTLSDDVVY